jgi:thiamine biosynthesis lipoprotein
MKYTKLIIFLIISTLILSCSEDKKYNIELKGNTMGTYYLVSLVDVPKNLSKKEIEIEIKNTLLEANKILSNWDKSSEISKLNNNKTIKPIQISNELFDVVSEANSINTKSNGYFDITLDPLIELWGFGYSKGKIIERVPNKDKIRDTLTLVNQNLLLEINSNNQLIKKNKNVRLNLSAIGKGYGIDLIGKKLDYLNINNYIIDIGGDIFAKGHNKNNKDWVVGIENPKLNEKLIKEIVNVSNKGVATSGEYKNYFSKDGTKYSHIINPKNGMPITHSTKSVTVVDKNAMSADGWATALIAMGSEVGLKVAEKEKIAVMFIDQVEDKLLKIKSSEFKFF